MTVIKALFGETPKRRTTLRVVAKTTANGRTVTIPDELLKNKTFVEKSSKLAKLAERVVPLQAQTAH
jgi:hypothetical protein